MSRSGFLLALLCCAASPSAAQAERDSEVTHTMSTFSPGQPIRIALLRVRWAGLYRGVNVDTVFLSVKGGPPMAIRFNAIDTLWRGGRATGRGARVGALSGAFLGGLAFAIAASSTDSEVGVGPAIPLGIMIGGAEGAVAGALVGATLREWRRVYP